jgi:hypothetical protein
LRAIEDLIAARPAELSLQFGRACCLDDLGRPDEAIAAYLAVLQIDAAHFGALTNLGSLYFERGYLQQAWTCFQTALARHPDDPMGHLNIAQLYAARGADDIACAHYELVIRSRPNDPHSQLHAHNGLSQIFERQGDLVRADEHLDRAFAKPLIWNFPYRGTGEPLRVLLLASSRGGDVISNLFFDDRVVQRLVLVPEAFRDGVVLPPHHIIFNGLGEPDRNARSLARAERVVVASGAPVINDPALVARTDRATMMQRLGTIDGIIAPLTRRYARAAVTPNRLEEDGFRFPLLLRSPGFHAGEQFELAARPHDLPTVLASLPGDELYAIGYHDARGDDEWVRKYRVAFIDGRIYPIHLALARQWKVHYFSAAMRDFADHRAEEARFLGDMAGTLGDDAMRALAAIGAELNLDYGGVDFGRDVDGRIIVFETNATMALYPPGDDPRWEYRRAPIDRAIAAVRQMLVDRAALRGYAAAS